MLKLTATNAYVSAGYDNAPAVQISESGNSARFRVGYRVYDKNAENNHRYINLTVKAFGPMIKKITDMKIAEGSMVNLTGRFDEETWTDRKTGETRKGYCVILEDIEYLSLKSSDGSHKETEGKTGFTGYEHVGPSYFDD